MIQTSTTGTPAYLGGRRRRGVQVTSTGGGGGGFSPTSIAGLLAWWDFSALGLTDGTPIASVTDGSGSGNTLSQATGANQPTYKVSIQNGRAMALFNGATINMTSALSAATDPVTIMIVSRPTSFATVGALIGASADGGLELRFDTTGKITALKQSTAAIATATNADTVNVATVTGFTYDASGNYAIFQNGTANGSGLSNQLPFVAGTMIVGQQRAGAEPYTGYIGEILKYNSVLSTTDRQSVESYLRSKWGTP